MQYSSGVLSQSSLRSPESPVTCLIKSLSTYGPLLMGGLKSKEDKDLLLLQKCVWGKVSHPPHLSAKVSMESALGSLNSNTTV